MSSRSIVCHLPVKITEPLLPVLTDSLKAFCLPLGIVSISTGEDRAYDSWARSEPVALRSRMSRAGCISLYRIATMRKPATNISLGDRLQRLFDGVNQGLHRPRFGTPQPRFPLRPALLNRMEIRRRGRQPDAPRPACRQQGFHPSDFMGRAISPEDNSPWPQGRTQDVTHPPAKIR